MIFQRYPHREGSAEKEPRYAGTVNKLSFG
jgi:hypothetical protein